VDRLRCEGREALTTAGQEPGATKASSYYPNVRVFVSIRPCLPIDCGILCPNLDSRHFPGDDSDFGITISENIAY
jgi:hypothetical protein